MYEYILIKGINTFEEDATALRDFVNKTNVPYVINLIPFNSTGCEFIVPNDTEIKHFKEYLKKRKLNFVERYSFGQEIKAACGQLARRENV